MKSVFNQRGEVMKKQSRMKSRLRRMYQRGASVVLWGVATLALAGSHENGKGDFSLDTLNSAIEGHLKGDFGKLMGLASIGWLIIGSVAGFNVRLLVSVFVLMLAISFGPGLVSSVVGGAT
jgi:hypothetical protein